MPLKAVAYSQLARQRALLAARFTQRYPHYWLVWEPGAFAVPRGNVSASATALPDAKRVATPARGEPLCFVLEPKADGTPTAIGRAEGNDLVLSDETISRHHCALLHEPTGWAITCSPEATSPLRVQGQALAPGHELQLGSSATFQLGNVTLTFMSAWSLAQRLDAPPG